MICFFSGFTLVFRVFTTVVNGIGPSFSPNRSPSITPPYLTAVRSVCWSDKHSGKKFLYSLKWILS